MVGERGIEPRPHASDAWRLPLSDFPMAGAEGFEPSPYTLTEWRPAYWTTPQQKMVGDLRFELRLSRVQGEREQPDFPSPRLKIYPR
jgi:hypothetical protein